MLRKNTDRQQIRDDQTVKADLQDPILGKRTVFEREYLIHAEVLVVDDSSDDVVKDVPQTLNFKRDNDIYSNKRAKVEQDDRPLHTAGEASTYDFGDLTRQENPLRKLCIPMELLREFQDFEIRINEKMASFNPPHNVDYARCMFCWLKHTMAAADPLMRDLVGRFLLFTGA